MFKPTNQSRSIFEVLKRSEALRLDIDTSFRMFDTLVVSIVLYGCGMGMSNTCPS